MTCDSNIVQVAFRFIVSNEKGSINPHFFHLDDIWQVYIMSGKTTHPLMLEVFHWKNSSIYGTDPDSMKRNVTSKELASGAELLCL